MHAAVSFFVRLRSKKGDSDVVSLLLIARGDLAVSYDSRFILARCQEGARSFLTHTQKKRAQTHVPRAFSSCECQGGASRVLAHVFDLASQH